MDTESQFHAGSHTVWAKMEALAVLAPNKKVDGEAIYLGFCPRDSNARPAGFRRPTLYPAELRRHIASFIIAIRIAISCAIKDSIRRMTKGKRKVATLKSSYTDYRLT